MNTIIHILLTILISVVIGAGAYWIKIWKQEGVMMTRPREFFIGGMSAEFFFGTIAFIGLVLGILTR